MVFEFLSGLAIGMGLILTIGAQNAFVIRQGLRGEHVFAVSLTCALSDALLVSIGVVGMSRLALESIWLINLATALGIAFLIVYGFYHFVQFLKSSQSLLISNGSAKTLREAVIICLTLTWLNPHVYLETVLLIGSLSAAYDRPWVFGMGAVLASFIFFFSLSYAALFFSRYLTKSSSWRLVDLGTALIMWAIALQLLWSVSSTA